MLLYNITLIVEETIADKWQQWMQAEHIPNLLKEGYFQSAKLWLILDSPNEGKSFSLQLISESEELQQSFAQNHEHQFTATIYAKYPKQVLAFSTLMQHID